MTNSIPESITNFTNAIKNLINMKANKNNGVSEITDSDSNDYTHIATMQSGATQQTINDSINIELGKTAKKSNTPGLIKNDGTIDTNNYLTTSDASLTYVAKEAGKGLSSNDYTTTEKNKLANLHTVATTGNYNNLNNKPSIPTLISDLTDDVNVVTEDNIDDIIGLSYDDETGILTLTIDID